MNRGAWEAGSRLLLLSQDGILGRLGQPVGVAADFFDGVLAVGLVDAHRPAGADPVGVQKDHDLTDDLLFHPCLLDPLPALGADAGHIPAGQTHAR